VISTRSWWRREKVPPTWATLQGVARQESLQVLRRVLPHRKLLRPEGRVERVALDQRAGVETAHLDALVQAGCLCPALGFFRDLGHDLQADRSHLVKQLRCNKQQTSDSAADVKEVPPAASGRRNGLTTAWIVA
jgi:hypothetical protein